MPESQVRSILGQPLSAPLTPQAGPACDHVLNYAFRDGFLQFAVGRSKATRISALGFVSDAQAFPPVQAEWARKMGKPVVPAPWN